MQLKHLLWSALVAGVALAQNDTATMNLTSVIGSNQNLSMLAGVLGSQQDFAKQVANMTNVTLFAPSNAAFEAIGSSALAQLTSEQGAIQALLMYHILPKEVMAANITSTPAFLSTALNLTQFSNVTGGQVVEARTSGTTAEIISGLKAVSNVTQADVKYNNGIIHVIDRVLTIPLNVSATAQAADLTALAGALKIANLTNAVDTAKDITIFAPNNDAFRAIATGLSGLSAAQVASILEYHVINGTIAYSSSLVNASLPSMQGTNLTITVDNSTGAVFVNSARVVLADVLLANGVLHVLDNVLNPNQTANATMSDVPVFSGASSGPIDVLTSGVAGPATTNSALATTDSTVAAGYSSVMGAGGSAASTGPLKSSSTSKAAAVPAATGAVGAAALFGGAAWLANW